MKRLLPLAILALLLVALLPASGTAGRVPPTPFTASQRFVWQAPLPQGNPIEAIDFIADTTGWAVGDNGTIMKTLDGGFSWTNQSIAMSQSGSDHTNNAYDICMVDSMTGYIGMDAQVLKTTDGGTTWAPINAWSTNLSGQYLPYQSIDFVDANNGWFATGAELFHTTNGGSTMTTQPLPAGTTANKVAALNSAEAYAFDTRTGYNGYLRTTDGGASWYQRYLTGTASANKSVWYLAAANSKIYATAPDGVYKSADLGSTWTTLTVTSLDPGDTPWLIFTDPYGLGVFTVTDNNILHRSSDGGSTWTKAGAANPSYSDFDAISASSLFRVSYSKVQGTADGGDSWYDCCQAGTNNRYIAIDMTSETTGHALTPYDYASTISGGYIWDVVTLASKGIDFTQASDMTFLDGDPNLGWIAGTGRVPGLPTVYKTTNGGTSWSSMEETRMVAPRRIKFSDASNGWAVYSYQDGFWHSSDGGNTWAKVLRPGSYWDLDFADANNGWIAFNSVDGNDLCLAHTEDGGSTWTTQTVGHTNGILSEIDFADANTGYAVDSFANIFKTTNGGDTWAQVSFPTTTVNLTDIKFSTPLDGWVIGVQQTSATSPSYLHDFAAHTVDGGATWDFSADAANADYGSTGTSIDPETLDVVGAKMWFAGINGSIVTTRPKPSATITSKSTTLTAYDQSSVVTGTVLGPEGSPLSGERVELWSSTASANAGFVKSTLSATTTAEGTFSITVKPRSHTYYKVKSTSDGVYPASDLSASVLIKAAPYVSNPVAPSTMYHTRYSTVYGYLKPKHTAGTYPVRIYRYRLVSGKYRLYGTYVKAKASNYSTYTKYSASVKLPYAGKWKVRAYHINDPVAGQIAKYSSGYDYITVK